MLKSSFDHFDRSKSSTYFFADDLSPFCNKLRKDFRISLDTTSPGKIFMAKERTWPLVLRVIDRTD